METSQEGEYVLAGVCRDRADQKAGLIEPIQSCIATGRVTISVYQDE